MGETNFSSHRNRKRRRSSNTWWKRPLTLSSTSAADPHTRMPPNEFARRPTTARPRRVYSFRNRARLNNLLELRRLSYHKAERVVGGYSTDIRRYLETHNGRPKRTYREAQARRAANSRLSV
jgi:hypothetical protein